ncbi:fungal specific transcription factor [Ophiocordyceps camponoti-floridani]|uniref:Fungal specific transcription factor n=1 Tax=Ophiocordyceps camponoti-floridani TaxID=2030778 RepID=A0A8H4Q254_9HYPO|nr:fungal specific transcription factor [Ophiocordyceps camponoti-floridani]
MKGAEPTPVRSRIPNACDGCKARKVKCDGRLPCGHCAARMLAGLCRYSTQRRRRQTQRRLRGGSLQSEAGGPERQDAVASLSPTPVPAPTSSTTAAAAEEETEVPREARLLCDAQGKLVFIGDCAPLSFFQSVRRLVTSRVGRDAFAPDSSRFSVLENAALAGASSSSSAAATHESLGTGRSHHQSPAVPAAAVSSAVDGYLAMTTGLVQLFDNKPRQLLDDLTLWAETKGSTITSNSCSSAVNYLVLSIGRLLDNEPLSRIYFEHGRDLALASLDGSPGIETVQAFVLVTVYMLCSCRINGGFLFFGIAVRAAYSLGLHRTEVNARFGLDGHRRRRDRLWQSLRVVDLCLSTSLGRPPATSDDDCTVSYTVNDLLGASVQILIITECIVLDVYSRRKISLQLTEGISRQLRDWAVRWLPQVRPALDVDDDGDGDARARAVGACQVLASYHNAVMLVCRPFLMYELCRRLAVGEASSSSSGPASSGRTRLADACIDAAGLMVDTVLRLIDRGLLNVRVPLLVSWLFASSLVLGVGLLGGFGRNLDKTARLSIRALDHFSKSDGHARQYSLIAQSLLETAQAHLERRDVEERQQRTRTSSQLFGLMMPSEMAPPPATENLNTAPGWGRRVRVSLEDDDSGRTTDGPPDWQDASPGAGDAGLLGFALQDPEADFWSPEDLLGADVDVDADAAATLNLFPLLDASGNIDLAHYL